MQNLNELTIKEVAAGLRQKKFSSRELVASCLKTSKEKNKEFNAYLDIYEDAAEGAKRADAALAKNKNLPLLWGIPVAIKDNILVKDKKATAGSKILQNYMASYDAAAVTKLKKQGAIIIGKTNLDEFAMGSSTENSGFGPTKNPHDPSRVPGGSSGGSAAAVALNTCIAALGSDTGGSIRQPASFCGVVGLKPTYGRVSRYGLIAMASSLDQIGPITKTVEDASILLAAIAGEDRFDATATRENDLEIGNWKLEIPENLKGFRVGLPKEYLGPGLDPEVKKITESALKKMERAGAHIKEITLPHSDYALPAYCLIVFAEISANLARFDGIRYGYQAPIHDTLFEVYARSRAQGLGEEVKRRIMLGTYTLSRGYYDAYYLKAQKMRSLIRQDFAQAFEQVDIIAGPTAPTPAFKLGEKSQNPLEMYLADTYTVSANLVGVPSISFPAGAISIAGKKLPVGLQLTGKWLEEKKLLAVAAAFEKINKPR